MSLSGRIHFGSLEQEDYEEQIDTHSNSIVKGMTIDELEVDQQHQVTVPSMEQAMYLDNLEESHRGKQLAIPTDDTTVRTWLRAIRHPITLFGEGPYDRRERLRKLLASGDTSSQYKALLSQIGLSQTTANSSEKVDDTEEFYVPGSEELINCRKWLVHYSLERSKIRLQKESLFKERPVSEIQQERQATYKRCSNFTLVASQIGGDRPVSSCSFSPDGHLIASGDFGGICRVWDSSDCSLVRELEGVHTSRVGSLAFNPDTTNNVNIATGDNDGKIALWSLDKPSPITMLTGHSQRVATVAFHPSGRLIGSASFDYSWRLWDVERNLELQLQEGHSRPVYSIAFQPDGALAATGGLDSHCRVWDLRMGRAIWTLQGHIKTILSIDFHPTMPLIASASEDGTVRIWDIRKLLPVYQIPAHTAAVSTVKWGCQGSVLLTAGFDGIARLWGSSDWKPIVTLTGHESKIYDADISDGKILTASADRTIKLWNSS